MELTSPYVADLERRLDTIHLGASKRLSEIPVLDPDVAMALAMELLRTACQPQNMGAITAGRSGLAQVPSRWLAQHLGDLAERALDLRDEWEYRRLLEAVAPIDVPMLLRLVRLGLRSPTPEVVEAALDFGKVRAAPQPRARPITCRPLKVTA